MSVTRWAAEGGADRSHQYVQRLVDLAAQGDDLHGEARFCDALLAAGSHVLDAGAGTGRTGAELARRGHRVLAVDADPVLVAAMPPVPGLTSALCDLAELPTEGEPFDLAVAAGNVLVYLAPGTEREVLRRIAGRLRPDGALVTGFALDREYRLDAFDADAAAVGLTLEHRFATWDLRAWHPGADWAVSVLRRER